MTGAPYMLIQNPSMISELMNEGGAFSLVISLSWLLVRGGIKSRLVCIEVSRSQPIELNSPVVKLHL